MWLRRNGEEQKLIGREEKGLGFAHYAKLTWEIQPVWNEIETVYEHQLNYPKTSKL